MELNVKLLLGLKISQEGLGGIVLVIVVLLLTVINDSQNISSCRTCSNGSYKTASATADLACQESGEARIVTTNPKA